MMNDFRDAWLSDLAQRMQLPELEFNDEGLCQLTLDQELIVTFHKTADNASLVLFGQIPLEPIPAAMMQKMLMENRSSARITAPVLSIAADLDAIEVHFKLSEAELHSSGDVLEQLIGYLEYWRNYAKS